MPYQKPSAQDNPVAAPSFPPQITTNQVAAWLAMALLAVGPVSFLLMDDAGGIVWSLIVLGGLFVACTAHRRWRPELLGSSPLVVCIWLLLLYLAMPVLSYFLVDNSDFAASRVKRQLLLLGIPFVLLLLWWLRLSLHAVLTLIALNATAFGLHALWFLQSNGEGRVRGEVNWVHFGNISLFLGFACLALFAVARHRGWRILAVAGMLLGGTASVLSGTRGSWIGVPLLLVVALIMLARTLMLRRSAVFGLVGLTALVLTGIWHTEPVQTRVDNAEEDLAQISQNRWTNSIGSRLLMWEQAWLEIRRAPLQGSGFSGYRNRMHAAVKSGDLSRKLLRYSNEPHNEYLYQWGTRGAVGLAVFLFCLAGAGWYFFRLLLHGNVSQMAIAQAGLSLVIIVAVGGLTITVIEQRAVIRFLVWILAILMYCVWLTGRPVQKALQD